MDNCTFRYAFCVSMDHGVIMNSCSFGMIYVSSMDHRVIMDKCAFPCAFLSSMDHRVKHGQLLLLESFLCLQWIIELNMDTFAFQYVFESSMYHIIILLSVAFEYAFCIFNVSYRYHGQFCLSVCFLCLQWIIELNMDNFAFQYVFRVFSVS